ncbi:MAG TPA: RNA polymerase sigma factor [Candidatus Sulfotelmatobacter sp.]|nr:RNA polymerase sigma factor [Candidatus Sulfotelmatobacter sp.]
MNAPADIPETQAIHLAQRGNARAFEWLYWAYIRRVHALCFRMAGNPSDAEDLAQEVFLQIFRKISSFRGQSKFSTWLYRVTVNLVLMRLRKKTVREIPWEAGNDAEEEEDAPAQEFGSPDACLVGLFDRLSLQGALGRLSPSYKAILILHDVEGYKHNEIAEILGCSAGNSKSQLHRARMQLRRLLRQTPGSSRGSQSSQPKPKLFWRPGQKLIGAT